MPESLDALLPPQMAEKAEALGVKKAKLPAFPMFMLAVLAGAFISLGAVLATVVWTGGAGMPWGIGRLVGGVAFSLGLILVVVGGAELFTGNNLIVMAWAGGKVSLRELARNWVVVYIGNFVGSIGTAALVFVARTQDMYGGQVGVKAVKIAAAKLEYGFLQAIALGILCNCLVCLAVWLSLSARSTADRIAAIVLPVTAFVACGFEHCVANMYFVPFALVLSATQDPSFVNSGLPADTLTWSAFAARNLLPVTLGNLIGGTLFVGGVYWTIYLRPRKPDKA